MEATAIVASVVAGLLGLLLGALWGRLGGSAAARTRELQAEVDALVEQVERAQADRAELESELEAARAEAGAYKKRVVEHFYGTSEQLRALTLQYRAVFDHLADGARELCPDSFTAIQDQLQPAALDVAARATEPPPLETDPEPPAEAETSAPPAEAEAASAGQEPGAQPGRASEGSPR